MGSKGLVLAAETAVGKNPHNCVKILKKLSKHLKKNQKANGKNFNHGLTRFR